MLKKQGFTQIDLVVSLAMAAVVSAMALPTVQKAREKSKQEMCAQRVTRFTMASLEYQEVNGTVPPCTTCEVVNTVIPDFPEGNVQDQQFSGAITYLLPFIGRQDLAELLPEISTRPDLTMSDSEFGTLVNILNDPGLSTVLNAQVPEWICPANPNLLDGAVPQIIAGIELFSSRVNFQAFPNFFTLHSTSEPPTTEFGRTSYLPIMGSHAATIESDTLAISFIDSFGPHRNRTASIATDDLGDGASNTLFWSESLGDIVPPGVVGNETEAPLLFTAHSSIWHSGLFTGYRSAFVLDGNSTEFQFFGNAEQSVRHHVGSNHPGGNNVSLSDGSVKFLSDRINFRVYTLLGAGNDGVYDNRE